MSDQQVAPEHETAQHEEELAARNLVAGQGSTAHEEDNLGHAETGQNETTAPQTDEHDHAATLEESGEAGPVDVQDDTAAESSRANIEREASEHLARRASEMHIPQHPIDDTKQAHFANKLGAELPASPPPPKPPVKDEPKSAKSKGKEAVEEDYDEKHPPVDTNTQDVPEAPQDSNEQTGAEIQTIMDQFQAGLGAGVEEIMSPRLEKQQPVLQLPPRSSSLEPKDKYIYSPQADIDEHVPEPDSKTLTAVQSSQSQSAGATDDTASLSSHRTSVFQPPPPSPDPEPAQPFDFHRFLEQLRHRTADPVARFLRSFLQEFGKKQWMVHEQVKIIGDFLAFITQKMAQCEVWRTVSDIEFDNAKEGMEKLVMNRLYSQTFSPAIPTAHGSPRKGGRSGRSVADAASPHGPGRRGQHQEDVERDEVIAQKMRIYGWIKEEHLDIKPMGEKGRKFLVLAQQELLKINTYRAPRDKVICVLNCCKVIFGFLKNSKADQSADAFVPLLIYTVLRARPEHLVSNVQYIWRFRNQEKLGGEAGYYMSSLMGVVSFLENLDRTALTISDEDFEKNVEQAVSAIAEGHKAEDYESKSHSAPSGSPALPGMQHLSEKAALSRPEVTTRNSMDAERSTPKRNPSQRLSEKAGQALPARRAQEEDDDDTDAVTGLLRTIQKPLSSIGRMFSDDTGSQRQSSASSLRTARTPTAGNSPRGLSPAPRLDRRTSAENKSPQRRPADKERENNERMQAEDSAARQASTETEQARRARARELGVVVETLQGMFPNLDKEVIEDVVRAQEGNVGRAVDACLALSV